MKKYDVKELIKEFEQQAWIVHSSTTTEYLKIEKVEWERLKKRYLRHQNSVAKA